MKPFFTFFLLLCATLHLSAQTPACTPDPLYKDSTSGVYPYPEDAQTNPNGGIQKPICIGRPYDFTFSVNVDSTVRQGGFTIRISEIRLNSVSNLPQGITYACNPANCVFKKNTRGCVILQGTTNVTPRQDTLKIQVTVVSEIGNFNADYPSSQYPGNYILRTVTPNDSRCLSSTQTLNEVEKMSLSPNPTNDLTMLFIQSSVSDKFDFVVTDLLGKVVFKNMISLEQGDNKIQFNTTNMPNGIYQYALMKGNRLVSGKMIVQR